MWYRLAQQRAVAQGVGGGIMRTPSTPLSASESSEAQEPQAQMWDTLVRQTDHVGNHKGQPNETTVDIAANEGPATQGTEMRRLSPYHSNPEHTTLEEQLDTARQQNVNTEPQSMSQQNMGTGSMLVRGLPQYGSGKGWVGFQGERPSTLTLV